MADLSRRIRLGFLRIGGLLLLCLLSVTAQQTTTPPDEKPRLKKFGESLKEKDKKNKNKPAPIDSMTENRIAVEGEEVEDIVRVETTLVVSDVLVLDQQGRAVSGLRQEDFILIEDDKPQTIGTFSLGSDANLPRSIVLIIDYSGSQLPYIENSVNAAQLLVDKLNPKDRMAIVTDDVELLTDFTADKALLKEKLNILRQYAKQGRLGRSRQYSALLATLRELFDEEDLRPIIIFQTDGDEFYNLRATQNYPHPPEIRASEIPHRNFTYEDVLAALETSRATIYTVIPGQRLIGISPEAQRKAAEQVLYERVMARARQRGIPLGGRMERPPKDWLTKFADALYREQFSIAGIAKLSGGWWEFLEQPQQADEIYSRILNSINLRYVIGYYPIDQTRDGRRRKVKIEVRGHPEYIVWGRKIYTLNERDNR